MDLTWFDKLRPYISKLIAAPVAIILMWLAEKTGAADLGSPETQATVIAGITWLVSEVVHVYVSKHTNPANAASAELATQGVVDNAEAKKP